MSGRCVYIGSCFVKAAYPISTVIEIAPQQRERDAYRCQSFQFAQQMSWHSCQHYILSLHSNGTSI